MSIDIVVAREAARPEDVDAALASLDVDPGLFYGCEHGVPGIHEPGGWLCLVPPLALVIEDGMTRPVPLRPEGAALAALLPPAGEARAQLRQLLAALPMVAPELGLYGAWDFDYRRATLFLPGEVLRFTPARAERVRFAYRVPAAGKTTGARPEPRGPAPRPGDDFRRGEYAPRVAEAVRRLRRGDVASLVLSQSFRRPWQGSAATAFQALRRANPNPTMFFVRFPDGAALFGASPDLQVRLRDGVVESAPVCGTLRRGGDPAADAAQLQELIGSAKEEASLAACSDADQVDKASIAVPGSITLAARRRPMFLATIVHTVDLVRAEVRPDADALDVLFAHRAPATIAGFPKATALRLIAELEASPRGWYGGAVTRFGADGSLEAGTILRAAVIDRGVAEVRTGGGLMPDSDPEREEAETWLKAEALFRALGLEPPVPPPVPPRASLPAPVAVRRVAAEDPFGDVLAGMLARIGCIKGDGIVVASGSDLPPRDGRPLLAIGDAALALLRADGATLETLDVAWSAKKLVLAASDGPFAALGRFTAGFYARFAVRAPLPAGWDGACVSAEGWLGAAVARAAPVACLLFRPESVVSQENDAGARAVAAALLHIASQGGKP